MKTYVKNPFFKSGMLSDVSKNPLMQVSTNVKAVRKLLELCPVAARTPLTSSSLLADNLGIKNLWFKDERERMGLGSFKAIGASFVIASRAAEVVPENSPQEVWANALKGKCFVSASAGNHGLSLAAGARLFGAKAVIYLSKNVPSSFADLIRSYDAEVIIHGDDYDESLQAAIKASSDNDWILLSDSTWEGYHLGVHVMQGYLVAAAEAFEDCPEPPTHIFLQAGVGGFPAAIAALARKFYGDSPLIVIVEPTTAPVLQASIDAGKAVEVKGGVSNMGRLDCKIPSIAALSSLSQTSNYFMTITDEEADQCLSKLSSEGLGTSPSGGAGYAGLIKCVNDKGCEISSDSRVMVFLSEKDPD